MTSLIKCYHIFNYHEYCRFVSSSVAGMCCRKVLLEYFDEDTEGITSETACCYVCDSAKSEVMMDVHEEIKLVLVAVKDLPGLGEVKVHIVHIILHFLVIIPNLHDR